MRRDLDIESGAREPLLAADQRQAGGDGGSGSDGAGGPPSRGLSPDRLGDLHPASTPGGAFRLTKRLSSMAQHEDREEQQHAEGGEGEADDEQGGLVLKDPGEDKGHSDVRELEVEIVAGAVAEAVAEAVQEAVQEAVHDAVQQAIEENVQFDVRANVYTLVAVTGVILFWRGVWNTWDVLFGNTTLESNVGSLVLGLCIMLFIRWLDLPLVQGLPGG